MVYAVLYMAGTRTQVYLTAEQRARIAELTKRGDVSLASIVREALDAFLSVRSPDRHAALDATFGALPALKVPQREEWERGGNPA